MFKEGLITSLMVVVGTYLVARELNKEMRPYDGDDDYDPNEVGGHYKKCVQDHKKRRSKH
jgi:hypothetical protein